MQSKSRPIIIDTDPGVDDALAIMFAHHSPELNIRGLTTVFGNQTIDKTTLNACSIVDVLNAKIPVFKGASHPLSKNPFLAESHGESGLGGYKETGQILRESGSCTPQKCDAIRFLAESITPGMNLACLGPLTNIALLINLYPESLKQVESLVIMGGVIDQRGNVSPWAEFNTFNDPDAWEQVLAFRNVKKIVIPANICREVQMDESDFLHVKNEMLSSTISKIICEYVTYYKQDLEFGGFTGGVMYDSLVIAYLLWPELFNLEPRHIVVETGNGPARGATAVDTRYQNQPNCMLVTRIDAVEVKHNLLSLLS